MLLPLLCSVTANVYDHSYFLVVPDAAAAEYWFNLRYPHVLHRRQPPLCTVSFTCHNKAVRADTSRAGRAVPLNCSYII